MKCKTCGGMKTVPKRGEDIYTGNNKIPCQSCKGSGIEKNCEKEKEISHDFTDETYHDYE